MTDPQKLIGKTDSEQNWNEEKKAFLQSGDTDAFTDGISKLGTEQMFTCADGRIHWMRTNKLPIKNADQQPVGVLGTYEDITEQKRMKEAIERRVMALTQPIGNIESITFEELFDLDELQRIQDEFAEATGVASVITKTDGTPITRPSNFSTLCSSIIRNTEKGRKNCERSDAVLGKYHPEGPIIRPCLSCGLWDAGVSIMVGDHHIANWLIGQVRNETQSEDKMRFYALEIGADEDQFIAAYSQVTQMTKERFESVAQAVFTLANQLSQTAYQNLQQARFIAEKEKTDKRLLLLSTVLEQTPEEVIITDTNGIIQYVNPAFETTTGYSRSEAVGHSPGILKSGQQRERFYSELWAKISSGEAWRGHLINQRKNGEKYTVETTILPVRASGGEITGYAAIQRDITHELLQEQKLRQSQKMEAIGQLAGGIAHDFNNILQAILGLSELLMLDLEDSSNDSKQQVGEIQKAAKHAANLTRQLLAFSRMQTTHVEEVDLNLIITHAQSLSSSVAGENIRFKVIPSPTPVHIQADARQVERMILNLVINARDAMPQGGELILKTDVVSYSQEDADNNFQIHVGDFARLLVSDTGTGMSPSIMEHIFEPFFTTKGPNKGTGLGLSAIYGIMQDHEGWINVYSEPGKGSCFKLHFPLYDQSKSSGKTKQPEKPSEARFCMDGERQLILLVEDDQTIRQVTTRALTKAGYSVISASSAEDAEKIFHERKDEFELLISDIILPEKNGAELAGELTTIKPDLPVILCSGYSGDRIKREEINQRGYRFLEKPISITDLLWNTQEALHPPA